MSVVPTSVQAACTGITLTFTYTAATGGTSGGVVDVVVPAGWPAPSTTAAHPGYTTASAGALSVSGQTVKFTGVTLIGGATLTVIYVDKTGGGPGFTAPSATGSSTF